MSSLVNFFNSMSLKGNNANFSTPRAAQRQPSPPSQPKKIHSAKRAGRKRTSETCVICFQHCISSSFMKAENCEHAVCDSCLRAYFQSVLNEGRYTSFERIECPSPGCNATFLSNKVTQNIFTDPQRNDWWTMATIKANIHNKVRSTFIRLSVRMQKDLSK
ncbi:hypothetical protein BD408DRAFT_162119 [Parasitella parasitica]|nr:hypothetical protein BD408DRAFT_162119 [Parasitella parasitica]